LIDIRDRFFFGLNPEINSAKPLTLKSNQLTLPQNHVTFFNSYDTQLFSSN